MQHKGRTITEQKDNMQETSALKNLIQQQEYNQNKMSCQNARHCNQPRTRPPRSKLPQQPNRVTAGKTALHYVCRMDATGLAVELLKRRDLDLDKPDCYGTTPLYIALFELNSLRMAKLLFGHGASAEAGPGRGLPFFVEYATACSTADRMDGLRLLVTNGADVNARDRCAGRTALHLVAITGYAPLARQLVAWGARADARDVTGGGRGVGNRASRARTANPTPRVRCFMCCFRKDGGAGGAYARKLRSFRVLERRGEEAEREGEGGRGGSCCVGDDGLRSWKMKGDIVENARKQHPVFKNNLSLVSTFKIRCCCCLISLNCIFSI